jgi:hypothetical protein
MSVTFLSYFRHHLLFILLIILPTKDDKATTPHTHVHTLTGGRITTTTTNIAYNGDEKGSKALSPVTAVQLLVSNDNGRVLSQVSFFFCIITSHFFYTYRLTALTTILAQ